MSIHRKRGYAMGTRGAWAQDFLKLLGNNAPDEKTIKLVAAWTRVENTQAKFNPLGTTYDIAGATEFNSVGVKNFPSRSEGLRASVETLNGNFPGYSELKQGLLTNDPQRALTSGGFDTWGSGTPKVLGTYTAIDARNEPLKSEETGSVSGGSWDSTQEPQSERTRPENERQPQRSFGEVTESDIRNIFKTTLGIVLIVAGVMVFVVGIINTEKAQQAIETAASFTPVGRAVELAT